jgi:pectinesterase
MSALAVAILLLASGCSTRETVSDVEKLTDVRFVEPRQDLAWENDRIAFRMYGPALAAEVSNGIDVWSKRVRHPIIEAWYAGDSITGPARRSYHVDHGEGADFFAVGRTLGCGGSAIWDGDSLLQPGVFQSYRIITTGPDQAEFELTYRPVMFQGRAVRETRRVSLKAGQHLNRFDVRYDVEGAPIDIPFAIGLVKRKNVASMSSASGQWVGLFGPTNDDPVNGSLGMGAILPGGNFKRISEDATHVLVHGVVRSGTTVIYYAGAGWTRSGFVADAEGWKELLERVAQELRH